MHGRSTTFDNFSDFFHWYNTEHHHSGLGYLTPQQVHEGRAEQTLAARQGVLLRAYEQHPERFPNGPPRVASPPTEVWINPPHRERDDLNPPASGVVVKSITRGNIEPVAEQRSTNS